MKNSALDAGSMGRCIGPLSPHPEPTDREVGVGHFDSDTIDQFRLSSLFRHYQKGHDYNIKNTLTSVRLTSFAGGSKTRGRSVRPFLFTYVKREEKGMIPPATRHLLWLRIQADRNDHSVSPSPWYWLRREPLLSRTFARSSPG